MLDLVQWELWKHFRPGMADRALPPLQCGGQTGGRWGEVGTAVGSYWDRLKQNLMIAWREVEGVRWGRGGGNGRHRGGHVDSAADWIWELRERKREVSKMA